MFSAISSRAISILLVAMVVTGVLTSCGPFFVGENTVVSVALSPASPTLVVGDTTQFLATGTKANGGTEDVTAGATWTSSKPSVANVTSTGYATAIAGGTTTITAKYEEGQAETFITVTTATLESITLSPTTTTLSVGGTQQFTATGTYSDGNTRSITSTVTWSSNQTGVATVISSGLVTGVGAGSTIITATLNGISAGATVTVD